MKYNAITILWFKYKFNMKKNAVSHNNNYTCIVVKGAYHVMKEACHVLETGGETGMSCMRNVVKQACHLLETGGETGMSCTRNRW